VATSHQEDDGGLQVHEENVWCAVVVTESSIASALMEICSVLVFSLGAQVRRTVVSRQSKQPQPWGFGFGGSV